MTLPELQALLLTTSLTVYHYEPLNATGKYIVWAEDGQSGAFHSDDKMTEQVIRGTIDFFTNTEFDPDFDKIQQTLNDADVSFGLNSVQYEQDTKYIHYEWTFEVVASIGVDDD